MLLPALASAKKKGAAHQLHEQPKTNGLAYRIWEGDNGDKYPMAVFN